MYTGVDTAQLATTPPWAPSPTVVAAPTEPKLQSPKHPQRKERLKRLKRQLKEDVRLLVRTPKTTIPNDPIFLAGLRGYLPFRVGRTIQKITHTKIGFTLWPFKGARAVEALHDKTECIEEIFRAKFENAKIERGER